MVKFKSNWGRRVVIGVPFIWLLVLFLVPFLIVLRFSLVEMGDGDRFGTLATFSEGIITLKIKVSTYISLFQDDLYVKTYKNSLTSAFFTTVLCLLIGYPFAWFMARAKPSVRPALMMAVLLPFWTSFLLRIYAWKGILSTSGLLNQLLMSLGLIQEPLQLLHTQTSLLIGMVYAHLPFMILPLYANLVKMDSRFFEAASDLGATPWQTFWLVVVPLSKSGIIAGAMLVFIPCVGEFVIPELLGGPDTLMIGKVLYDEFFSNNDWPMASAVTVVVALLILVPMAIFNKYQVEQQGGRS